MHEVAQGLAYLHSHKVVHGDVKGVSVRNHYLVSFVDHLVSFTDEHTDQ